MKNVSNATLSWAEDETSHQRAPVVLQSKCSSSNYTSKVIRWETSSNSFTCVSYYKVVLIMWRYVWLLEFALNQTCMTAFFLPQVCDWFYHSDDKRAWVSFFFLMTPFPRSAGGLPEPSFHLSRRGGTEEYGEQLPCAAASLWSHRTLFIHSFPSGGSVSWRRQAPPLTLLDPVQTSSHTVTRTMTTVQKLWGLSFLFTPP